MNHTFLINYLIDKYKLKSYLEIGIRSTEQNFDRIECDYKWGVDPEVINPLVAKCTSDEFFDINFNGTVKVIFDLIFIDGDHTAEQVERDFNNSLKCLNDGGYIILHDVLPEREETTHVPRDSKEWHGNVYQFAMTIKYMYDGIDLVTLNMDCGCMVVWKDKNCKEKIAPYSKLLKYSTGWGKYINNRKELMNVIEPEVFFKPAVT